MAQIVSEIMNHELFSVSPEESAERARSYILALDITGAPVVDAQGKPTGMVSLRDLVDAHPQDRVTARMTRPPVTIVEQSTIHEAARLLAETGLHRLIVVDRSGRVIGMVSAVDVLRGMLGLPARHPSAFPHFDPETGLTWTDAVPLGLERIEAAPAGGGVLVLMHGGADRRETVVWVEAAEDLRGRLLDMLTTPETNAPLLAAWLASTDGLRFCAAAIADREQRLQTVARLRMEMRVGAVKPARS